MSNIQEAYCALHACILQNSYREGKFTLVSGQSSKFYIDLKQVMFRPDAQLYLGKLLFEMTRNLSASYQAKIAGVGGMALGAVPLVIALSNAALSENRNWPGVVARKMTKAHGTNATLEGSSAVFEGATLVLVEDTVTTGGSTIQAAMAYREAGFAVSQVLAVVDRQAGGEQKLQAEGLELHSLYSIETLQGGKVACEKRFQQLWPQAP